MLYLNFIYKLIILLLICIPLIGKANNVSAKNFYIGASGAFSHYPAYKPGPKGGREKPIGIDIIKNGYALSLIGGYRFCENFRAEGELAYRKHIFDKFVVIRDYPPTGVKKGDVIKLGKTFGYVHSLSYMANFYYDYANRTKLTPFVGIGGGIVRYEERNKCGHDVVYSPALQVIAGASYVINSKLNLEMGYRYYHMKDVKIKNNCLSPKIKYSLHEGLVGVRFSL